MNLTWRPFLFILRTMHGKSHFKSLSQDVVTHNFSDFDSFSEYKLLKLKLITISEYKYYSPCSRKKSFDFMNLLSVWFMYCFDLLEKTIEKKKWNPRLTRNSPPLPFNVHYNSNRDKCFISP